MQTIKTLLETLKEPYKSKALANTSNEMLEEETINLSYALLDGFTWAESPEGSEYWSNVHTQSELENPNYFEIQSS